MIVTVTAPGADARQGEGKGREETNGQGAKEREQTERDWHY